MQHYIPTQDILGTLSDVFSKCNYKYDENSTSETLEKFNSMYKSKIDNNDYKSKLDSYIEKIKKKNQLLEEQNLSISSYTNYNELTKTQKLSDSQKVNHFSFSHVMVDLINKETQTENIDINTNSANDKIEIVNQQQQIFTEVNECEIQVDNPLSSQYYQNELQHQNILNINEQNNKQQLIYPIYLDIEIQTEDIDKNYQMIDISCQTEISQQQQYILQNIKVNQQNIDNLSNQPDLQGSKQMSELFPQSSHTSGFLDNLQLVSDRINDEQIHCQCGKLIINQQQKQTQDVECQYDKSELQNNSLSESSQDEVKKSLRSKSRCLSQVNQSNNKKIQFIDDCTLEEELQLRDELLQSKFIEIQNLQQQIEDLHKLLNEQQNIGSIPIITNIPTQQSQIQDGKFDLDLPSNVSRESESSVIEQLNKQLQSNIEIQGQLTEQMISYSQQLNDLKLELTKKIEENEELIEERERFTVIINELKEQLMKLETEKVQEIDSINEDFRDKMSKQSMIIDELQQQLNSIGSSPIGLNYMNNIISMPQTMKLINQQQQQQQLVGSDSQLSRGSVKTKEEKELMMRNLKKMTSITAGLMSTKQDYTTLGMLGRMDQVKSQQKLDSFNKLN